MKLGLISKYRVERETNLGYMISDDTGEYFLHHNECCGEHFKDGVIIDAFLYIDKMKRVAATFAIPKVTVEKGGLCEVVETSPGGVFVNIGISRDILLSSDELLENKWPQIGDTVCCNLRTRGNNLFIRFLNKQEILNLSKGPDLEVDKKYQGYVYRITEKGINIVTKDFKIVFIYYINLRKDYRIGELVEVKIVEKNDNDYTGTMIEQKEIMIKDDGTIILEFLKNHNGVMNYTSKSTPEVIFNVFKMSKASFKRALGNLYKQKKVLLEEDKTIMVDYLEQIK
jgi:predicted RNA-binding protein (virulence factor B family)